MAYPISARASKLRSHVVKLRFSPEERELIQALTNYTGEQPAVLLRELILEQAVAVLMDESGNAGEGLEVPARALDKAL